MAMKYIILLISAGLSLAVCAQRPHAESMLNLNYDQATQRLENSGSKAYEKEFWRHDMVFLQLYLADNQSLREAYEDLTDEVEDLLDDQDAHYQLAELYLKNAIVRYFNGERFGTARAFYASYNAAEKAYENNPSDYRAKSLYGLFQILVGSIPDSYGFLVSVLGVTGDVELGERLFKEAALEATKKDNWYAYRVRFLYTFYLFQKTGTTDEAMKFATSFPESILGDFLLSRIHLKAGNSSQSRELLRSSIQRDSQFHLPYTRFLLGKQLIESGDRVSGRKWIHTYLTTYRGREYIRAANLYLSWSYLVEGNDVKYREYKQKIKNSGRGYFGDDILALYESGLTHHPTLIRARMAHDSMDFNRCEEILERINPALFSNTAFIDEYYYRRGRNFQKLKQPARAEEMFTQLLSKPDRLTAYYQPNAALQMAYICFDKGQKRQALKWAERVFEYEDYPFNAPIEWQAKEMLQEGENYVR
jgi:tetratricopeptide (TPR) repeat protein